MTIDKLDEFQGLTLEMVHSWLTKYRWASKTPQIPEVRLRWWTPPRETTLGIWLPDELDGQLNVYLGMALETVASDFGWSVQELLREINPRMRKGMPSQAALAAHNHWLVRDTETGEISLHRAEGGNLYSVIHYRNGTKNPDSEALPDFGTWMEFWPCDEHGNKVRWPTDAQGNML